ncbi:MAG: bifunctional diaminohydroxyphosphoribosylaminopyrimidine deaminase/5-amino-6-(5-phosphoribosylamino)uracil reductase RibD [Muribaculaceae bacterium]|nr:bifunctional diaminohydroxyphosphoribosylaminopyrimidine deaminase/5-amino-6-(5-phosphoribosylamino)uracil reductase RibD [Muribaculaceae bacterium]
MTADDHRYMLRACQLAHLGLGNTSPNPHVGAVIVADGRIIGEGSHRKIGEGHAEVNAIRSVKPEDRDLLKQSTMYVTLEPCSHFGKTPPCARLIVETGIPRVVIASADPSPKVNGKGIAILREAGVDVEVMDNDLTVLADNENRAFRSPYINNRPLITLKWAQSADGFMAGKNGKPVKFSTPLTSTLVHKLRSEHDVILTTAATVNADNPLLDCRLWKAGRAPRIAVVDRWGTVNPDSSIFSHVATKPLVYTETAEMVDGAEMVRLSPCNPEAILADMMKRGYNSVLVEAGPTYLSALIDSGLYDTIRVETAPIALGDDGSKAAPALPGAPHETFEIESNQIHII